MSDLECEKCGSRRKLQRHYDRPDKGGDSGQAPRVVVLCGSCSAIETARARGEFAFLRYRGES